ncbi:MAG TPA: protein kinase, partial [Gemmatimonadales bacterium]|nr:protein kinase [Gemmatimonadales bacterium]
MTDPVFHQLQQATQGEYRILRELGRGGMAAVYLAEDLSLGRRVAVKVMLTNVGTTAINAERFLLEARTAAQLSHSNIIPIYAVRLVGELRYFVMKYLPGRSLDQVLRQEGPLSIPLVLCILGQVGAALEHAHSRGVIHRDIKPANVVIDEEGSAIVADFGIAKVAHGAGLTQTGTTVGTPSYMSPEQCTGKPVTGAADQYALGCVAFELLTGRPPFVHEEVVPVFMAHVSDPPPPLIQLRPDVPFELAEAVDRMLAKDPADRWPTIEAAGRAAGVGPAASDPVLRAQLRDLAGPFDEEPWEPTPLDSLALATAAVGSIADSALSTPEPATAVPESRPIAVRLVPGGGFLAAGQHAALMLMDPAGASLGDVEWSSSDAEVLRVMPDGELIALRPGTATIIARRGGSSAVAEFQVTRVEAATVRILPQLQALGVGEEVGLQAVVADRLGVTLRDRVVSWRTDSPQVAVIAGDGVLRGVAPGRAVIHAVSGTGMAALELRVTPAKVTAVRIDPGSVVLQSGESLVLRAEVQGGRGAPMRGIPIEWQSSDPAIAAIDQDGTVRGMRFGTARIAATAAGRRATVSVEVKSSSMATISGPRLRVG